MNIYVGADYRGLELKNEIIKYLKERTIEGDIVLTLGAGTVTNIGPKLVD